MSLQPISTLTGSSLEELETLYKQLQIPRKSLRGQSKGKDFPEGKRRHLETLDQYSQSLKALIQGKKASIVPTRTGQGIV